MQNQFEILLSLPRFSKKIIAMLTDTSLCIISSWVAYVLVVDEIILPKDFDLYAPLLSIIIAIPIFTLFGLYKSFFRYADYSFILNIFSAISVYSFLFFAIVVIINIHDVPKSIGVFQPMLLFFGIMASRLIFKVLFDNYSTKKSINKRFVLVYGAGEAGRQLVFSMENSSIFKVVGFIDDNKLMHNQMLLGKPIYHSSYIKELVKHKKIDFVFLALPSIGKFERNNIINKLNQYKFIVKTLPSVSDIVDGKVTISNIKDFNINDLLNRDEVKPNTELLEKNINSKTVLVTGAGGSIGSELCRQIIKLKPNKLILIELSEFALYKIFEELISYKKNLRIVPLLTNAQNQKKLEIIFDTFKVDTVYHAAAYKHVTLVEENICEGIKNNVFSTLAVAKACILKNVSNLVLISSDKAVRPTNVMGASKRLSELCIQGIYNYTKTINSNFSIVRFGNVLESSGSVIPKFIKQIKEGGSVTLTHPEVTRYFMTVTEAAQLVIQAGAMGKKAEVFILDMGESIKIIDLINKIIRYSGFSIRDDKNLTGDIEIKITGLKTGEKLHEELLIGKNPQKTFHEKILKAQDPYIPFEKLELQLDELFTSLRNNKTSDVKEILSRLISSYNSKYEITDHVYQEQLNSKITKEKLSQPHHSEDEIIK
jgi:FlaA1/EpsC-like NDP-sugar epimerase